MNGAALAVTLAALAGIAGSVQAAVMGELGERVGIAPAVAFSAVVSFVIAAVALAAARRSVGDVAAILREPVWLWIGGALSLFIIMCITVAPPRIGVAATIGVVIAGQLVAGAVIDRFGLLGVEQIGLTWPRLLGMALLAAGAALTLAER